MYIQSPLFSPVTRKHNQEKILYIEPEKFFEICERMPWGTFFYLKKEDQQSTIFQVIFHSCPQDVQQFSCYVAIITQCSNDNSALISPHLVSITFEFFKKLSHDCQNAIRDTGTASPAYLYTHIHKCTHNSSLQSSTPPSMAPTTRKHAIQTKLHYSHFYFDMQYLRVFCIQTLKQRLVPHHIEAQKKKTNSNINIS